MKSAHGGYVGKDYCKELGGIWVSAKEKGSHKHKGYCRKPHTRRRK